MSEFTVRKGKRYRASIRLGLLEQIADNRLIASKLEQAGFSDVTVSGSGANRTAEGGRGGEWNRGQGLGA